MCTGSGRDSLSWYNTLREASLDGLCRMRHPAGTMMIFVLLIYFTGEIITLSRSGCPLAYHPRGEVFQVYSRGVCFSRALF